MFRLVVMLLLSLQTCCLTPELWRGSLLTDPVSKLVETRHCQVDSWVAGIYRGEPVLRMDYHVLGQDDEPKQVLLVSNKPPTEKTSPLFLLLKPGIREMLEPAEASLQFLTHRFEGSVAPAETVAWIGLKGTATSGPSVALMESAEVPTALRQKTSMSVSEPFEPRVQTLVDDFIEDFRLPGRPDRAGQSSWTPMAWMGPDGRALGDAEVVRALSEITGFVGKESKVRLLARRFSSDEGRFVYVAVALEYLMLQHNLKWSKGLRGRLWEFTEEFRVLPMPEDFAWDGEVRRALPQAKLDFFEREYRTTKGAVSDSLVFKTLLTPVTLTLDAVGLAFWAIFASDKEEDPPSGYPSWEKESLKWIQIR